MKRALADVDNDDGGDNLPDPQRETSANKKARIDVDNDDSEWCLLHVLLSNEKAITTHYLSLLPPRCLCNVLAASKPLRACFFGDDGGGLMAEVMPWVLSARLQFDLQLGGDAKVTERATLTVKPSRAWFSSYHLYGQSVEIVRQTLDAIEAFQAQGTMWIAAIASFEAYSKRKNSPSAASSWRAHDCQGTILDMIISHSSHLQKLWEAAHAAVFSFPFGQGAARLLRVSESLIAEARVDPLRNSATFHRLKRDWDTSHDIAKAYSKSNRSCSNTFTMIEASWLSLRTLASSPDSCRPSAHDLHSSSHLRAMFIRHTDTLIAATRPSAQVAGSDPGNLALFGHFLSEQVTLSSRITDTTEQKQDAEQLARALVSWASMSNIAAANASVVKRLINACFRVLPKYDRSGTKNDEKPHDPVVTEAICVIIGRCFAWLAGQTLGPDCLGTPNLEYIVSSTMDLWTGPQAIDGIVPLLSTESLRHIYAEGLKHLSKNMACRSLLKRVAVSLRGASITDPSPDWINRLCESLELTSQCFDPVGA
ncbi:uncharacterized protein ACA1_134150 [Acanthamoeba castellanii str. Neff]|uniref:Uncharacterized protein n=1 Tax=Acanthamoeba castellanii (strain ATCC 30010 / Neff) TaxID=1257118 RepID=L8GEQ3_ACACF|nr:uncharacterized protein ACA1_134150 [Acanthamoeba castellanii str. Neff]ELR11359.1 hypothetical protein ACA1_134150 [Acanthamoeba castellanii str. Neff]